MADDKEYEARQELAPNLTEHYDPEKEGDEGINLQNNLSAKYVSASIPINTRSLRN